MRNAASRSRTTYSSVPATEISVMRPPATRSVSIRFQLIMSECSHLGRPLYVMVLTPGCDTAHAHLHNAISLNGDIAGEGAGDASHKWRGSAFATELVEVEGRREDLAARGDDLNLCRTGRKLLGVEMQKHFESVEVGRAQQPSGDFANRSGRGQGGRQERPAPYGSEPLPPGPEPDSRDY